MKIASNLSVVFILLLAGCEKRLNPDDYSRECESADECESVAWLVCTSECGAMAVNKDEIDQVGQDLAELRASCGYDDVSRAASCRPKARSVDCIEGSCALLDLYGRSLGSTTTGSESELEAPE